MHDGLIHDWNPRGHATSVELLDETLRDGLQSPSVRDPSIDEKLKIVRLMDRLGIQHANVGLPGAGPRAVQDVEALVRAMSEERMKIRPACAARTLVKDLEPIVQIQQRLGVAIEAYTFIGSSPIRFFAEDWKIERVLGHIREALRFASKENLDCCLVTEDTTRSSPEMLRAIFDEGLASGVRALCLCDTVGHATPEGVRQLVEWTRNELERMGAKGIRLDWHGHNDRGLSVANALAAMQAGVSRIHGTALGVGERVGNASMDQLLVNLSLLGVHKHDVSALAEYCQVSADALGLQIPVNHPVTGRDAFRTATGVHAAAIIKAMKKNDRWLADRVYSAVPAESFGFRQEIEIGHMSGISNVAFWLEAHDIPYEDALAHRVFERAKASNRTLTDAEIWEVVRR